jgi:hypothetical protein
MIILSTFEASFVFIFMFLIFITKTLYLGIQGTSRSRMSNGDNEWNVSRADIVDRKYLPV